MADLNTDIMRKLKELEERISRLEHHEFAIMHTGSGAPAHNAVEGTLYWDYTNDFLYVNDDGTTNWTQQ
jgi:hypothetical protein